MGVDPPVHPDVAPIAFLLGEWEGTGEGAYPPNVAPFAYRETVRFWHSGKPFLAYQQRTTASDDGRPLHTEMGFWRMTPAGEVEVVMAHGTGFAEVELGSAAGQRIALRSSVVARTPSAKEVTALERHVSVEGDVLRYQLRMGMRGEPSTWHLTATLRRVG